MEKTLEGGELDPFKKHELGITYHDELVNVCATMLNFIDQNHKRRQTDIHQTLNQAQEILERIRHHFD